MKHKSNSIRAGFSLTELMVVIAVVAIPISAVTVLAVGGTRSFQTTYNSVHKKIKEDAKATTTAFGIIGRKSNRINYKIYEITSGTFTEASPPFGQSIASGQAVEFRYWQQPFDPSNPPPDAVEVTNTGTHYALFYLESNELRVDYGTVQNGIGAIQAGSRRTANITTQVLAENVDLSNGNDIFSHTLTGGIGNGSVRLNLKLTDRDGESVEIKTSALLRIIWPR